MFGKGNPRYKWVIAALCFLMIFTALGFCSSNKGLYLGAITGALDIKRGAFALNDSFRYIATAVVNLFFGFLVKKFGYKKLICAGFLSLIVSVLIYATAVKVWQFYFGGVFLGIGFSWTTTTIVGSVIGKWFRENRGTVMGAVLASNGLGGALAAQIVTPIIFGSTFGYRNAYFLIAGILLFVVLLIVLFFRNDPPETDPAEPIPAVKKRRGRIWEGITFSEALGKPYFWAACVCIFLTGMILQSVNGVAATHMKDMGVETGYLALVLTIHSVTLALLKFLTGVLYDKKGLRFAMTVCYIASVFVMLSLSFISDSALGRTMSMIYAIISCVSLPLETIMLPIFASEFFGEKDFNKMLGVFVSVNVSGYALGAPLSNLCFDWFGSYVPAFYVSAVLIAAVAGGMQFILSAANRERRKTLMQNN